MIEASVIPRDRVHFSSASEKWDTPRDLYADLHSEFDFTLDPCPSDYAPDTHPDGLSLDWSGHRVYCNPPYGRGVGAWLAKGRDAQLAVYLLPSRTDTAWWHDHAVHADEIRFVRGRLRFNDGPSLARAPFPSVLLIYRRAA